MQNAEDAGATEVDGLTVVDLHENDEEKSADVAFEQLFLEKIVRRLRRRPRSTWRRQTCRGSSSTRSTVAHKLQRWSADLVWHIVEDFLA